MSLVFQVIIFLLFAISLIGIFIPFMPGLVLAWLAFILFVIKAGLLDVYIWWVIFVTLLSIIAIFSDTIFSLLGAKVYNSSKEGIVGGVIGFFAGILLFPPFGAIVGPLLGVYVGEVMSGKKTDQALKSLWGAVLGFLISLGLKIIVWTVLLLSLFYFLVFNL